MQSLQTTIDVAVPVTTQAALEFNRHREPLWAAAQLLPSVIAGVVLVSGLGFRIRLLCSRITGGRRYWTVTTFACVYLVLAALVTLPFGYYRDVIDLHAWGEPTPAAVGWLAAQLTTLAAKLLVAALVLWIPYALLAASPRRWWLYSAAALVPVVFLILVALPVWVAPLTTYYTPLKDQALLSKIETLAGRCGVRNIPIFVGGNEDTVVGLGPTNRIVLNQEIFNSETADQIEFTIGHELKHYVMGDNWKALAILSSMLFAGFFLVDRFGRSLIVRLSGRIGFDRLDDPASLPAAILIFSLFWLAVSPLFNLYARHIELEADRFGLELTHQNAATAAMFAGFSSQHLRTVEWDRFQLLFYASHPSDGDRIRLANTYRPWTRGEPLAYVHICPSP